MKKTKARFLDGKEAWEAIRAHVLTEVAYVAVAWWGSGMTTLLPLREGSLLVVRADRKTMELGQTNPEDLLELFYRGVRIFDLPNLHAKVFAFSRTAFIGSMNASEASWQGRWLEAAVEVTGRNVVGASRRQVLTWARGKELDEAELKGLKQYYNPRGSSGRRRGERVTNPPQPPQPELRALRVLRTVQGDWKSHTQERFDKDSPPLKKKAASRQENLEAIEWSKQAPNIASEERILEIRRDADGTRWVSPPARPGPITNTKRGRPEKLLYLSRSVGLRRRRLTNVVKAVGRNSGLHRALTGRGKVFREVPDLERLYSIWRLRS